MFDSILTRSTAVGVLMACPHDDRAPLALMDWMAERKREKARLQRSQHSVLLNTTEGSSPCNSTPINPQSVSDRLDCVETAAPTRKENGKEGNQSRPR